MKKRKKEVYFEYAKQKWETEVKHCPPLGGEALSPTRFEASADTTQLRHSSTVKYHNTAPLHPSGSIVGVTGMLSITGWQLLVTPPPQILDHSDVVGRSILWLHISVHGTVSQQSEFNGSKVH